MNYVGIEIAKEEFKAAVGEKVLSFTNDRAGFAKLLKAFPSKKEDVQCVMEASGPYCFRLATYLYEKGIRVSVVNPLIIRRFCQTNLVRTKTDKVDALLIVKYAQMYNPPCWQPAPEQIQCLKELQSLDELLTSQETQLTNHLDAVEQSPVAHKAAISILKDQIKQNKQAQNRIWEEIDRIIAEHYAELAKRLRTIPGIGRKTSTMLIIITHGFIRFENAGQLLSYTGLTPRIYQSGKSVNRRPRITKMGMARMRQLLYMCSVTAEKYNLACQAMYERLQAKGKPKKVIRVALAAKLLRQAFAVAKGNPFDPKYSFGKKSSAA